jgi:hypothetical protein
MPEFKLPLNALQATVRIFSAKENISCMFLFFVSKLIVMHQKVTMECISQEFHEKLSMYTDFCGIRSE